MATAIETIQAEHRTLDRILGAMEAKVEGLTDLGPKPDLELLFSALYYIRIFPERYHHPKEEAHLFKALRRRAPDSAAVLDELEAQHQEGARLIADLDKALKDFDRDYPNGLADLRTSAKRYIDFQRRHIGQEEREVLPLARKVLSEADWWDIDQSFASNTDPLFADNLRTGFRALHDHIVAR